MKLKFYFLGMFSTVIIIAVAVIGYLLGKEDIDLNSETKETKSNYEEILMPTSDNLEELSVENFSEDYVKEKIILSVNNENYNDLIPYLTDIVNFRIEASECCDPMTKNEAVKQLEYLSSAEGEWDFSKEDSIASDLASTAPQHYSNSILGISSDEYVASFQLNNINKIYSISISPTYKIIIK